MLGEIVSFEESMNNTNLEDIQEMQKAVEEAFLPKGKHLNIESSEEAFLPEETKLQGKILLAEDRKYFLNNKKQKVPEPVLVPEVTEEDMRYSTEALLEESPEDAFIPPSETPLADPLTAREVFYPREETFDEDEGRTFERILDENAELKAAFDEARSVLEQGRVYHAKKSYNKARDILVTHHERFQPAEAQRVHDELKKLYDDIYLKHLEAEAIKRLEE